MTKCTNFHYAHFKDFDFVLKMIAFVYQTNAYSNNWLLAYAFPNKEKNKIKFVDQQKVWKVKRSIKLNLNIHETNISIFDL